MFSRHYVSNTKNVFFFIVFLHIQNIKQCGFLYEGFLSRYLLIFNNFIERSCSKLSQLNLMNDRHKYVSGYAPFILLVQDSYVIAVTCCAFHHAYPDVSQHFHHIYPDVETWYLLVVFGYVVEWHQDMCDEDAQRKSAITWLSLTLRRVKVRKACTFKFKEPVLIITIFYFIDASDVHATTSIYNSLRHSF